MRHALLLISTFIVSVNGGGSFDDSLLGGCQNEGEYCSDHVCDIFCAGTQYCCSETNAGELLRCVDIDEDPDNFEGRCEVCSDLGAPCDEIPCCDGWQCNSLETCVSCSIEHESCVDRECCIQQHSGDPSLYCDSSINNRVFILCIIYHLVK